MISEYDDLYKKELSVYNEKFDKQFITKKSFDVERLVSDINRKRKYESIINKKKAVQRNSKNNEWAVIGVHVRSTKTYEKFGHDKIVGVIIKITPSKYKQGVTCRLFTEDGKYIDIHEDNLEPIILKKQKNIEKITDIS